MTDDSAELGGNGDAVSAAEKILKEAARKIQTEQCPQGEECAVHHRVDEEYVLESAKYARYITYSGDYVVITEDNHVFGSPQFLIKALLGGVKTKEDLPPRWETSIFYVGDGTIGDLTELPVEERGKSLRYARTHDDWERIKAVHESTAWALEEGLIDVSKPFKLED